MASQDLYTLTLSRFNARRTIVYEFLPEAGSRRVSYYTEAINPEESYKDSPAAQPDSWPYAEGELITTTTEGSEKVSFYALRTAPFARFTVDAIGPNPGVVCDLQVLGLSPTSSSVSFQVSTSNGPWRSAIDRDEDDAYTENKGVYPELALGTHALFVRDVGGCVARYPFTVEDDAEDPADGLTPLPVGAILLRIRDKQVLNPDGTDYFQHFAFYYVPATRAVFQRQETDSLDVRYYSRPTAEVIDRWCKEPGVAPFTEIQVHHDGVGGVTFEPVDGVTACQISCTVYLTETHLTAEGEGEISVVAHLADLAGGRFSLDNFATAGVVAELDKDGNFTTTFTGLPVGRYVVSYQENRPGGCRASITVDLASSFGPRYRHRYRNPEGQLCKLIVSERDYQGPVENVDGAPSPVTINRPGDPTAHIFGQLVQGQELAASLLQTYRGQYRPLFSGDERLFLAEHYTRGLLDWRGYVLPEQYDVAHLRGHQFFNFTATDGLGTLSTQPFTLPGGGVVAGDRTLLDIILLCLNKLALDLPLHVLSSLYPVGADRTRSVLEQVKVDAYAAYYDEKGDPQDCGAVLNAILSGPLCQARLYQQDGAWWLERLADLGTEELTYFAYAPTGTVLPLVRRSLLREVRCDSNLYWQTAAQRQQARGAVALVRAESAVGELVNLVQRFLPAPDAVELPDWSGDAPYELLYEGKDKPPTLRLTGAQPGTTLSQALWQQLPLTQPIPTQQDASTNIAAFTLSFKARAYGQQLVDAEVGTAGQWTAATRYRLGQRVLRALSIYTALQDNDNQDPVASNGVWSRTGSISEAENRQAAKLYVAVKIGPKWIRPYGGSFDTAELAAWEIQFPEDKEQEVEIRSYVAQEPGAYPVLVRFYQVLPGAASGPVLVDISDISLTYENASLVLADSWTNRFVLPTGLRVTRQDVDTELLHLDTAYSRHRGTLLQESGLPTRLWDEVAGGQQKELGVYVVRDRASFQQQPAQVLTGVLRGSLGTGALLTDPAEQFPAVYVLTSWARDGKGNTHAISGVQRLGLLPLKQEIPADAIYHEDGAPWLSEAGEILLYENAYDS